MKIVMMKVSDDEKTKEFKTYLDLFKTIQKVFLHCFESK